MHFVRGKFYWTPFFFCSFFFFFFSLFFFFFFFLRELLHFYFSPHFLIIILCSARPRQVLQVILRRSWDFKLLLDLRANCITLLWSVEPFSVAAIVLIVISPVQLTGRWIPFRLTNVPPSRIAQVLCEISNVPPSCRVQELCEITNVPPSCRAVWNN